ncbi:MAG: DUF4142 domain-containing protein [Vicinamibacterales bacterium]
MKSIPLALALVASFALVACGGDNDQMGAVGTEPGAADTATGTDGMNAEAPDTDFLEQAMTSGMKEVQVSQLAQERASNAQVKAFAERMVQDHQQANDQLQQIVTQHGWNPSPDRDAINDARQELEDKTGADFDTAYMDMMVSDHEDAVGLLEDKVDDMEANPDVRRWATDTVPTLRDHLQQAQSIQKALNATH